MCKKCSFHWFKWTWRPFGIPFSSFWGHFRIHWESIWSSGGSFWRSTGSCWRFRGAFWSLSGTSWSFSGTFWSLGETFWSLGETFWSLGKTFWSLGKHFGASGKHFGASGLINVMWKKSSFHWFKRTWRSQGGPFGRRWASFCFHVASKFPLLHCKFILVVVPGRSSW